MVRRITTEAATIPTNMKKENVEEDCLSAILDKRKAAEKDEEQGKGKGKGKESEKKKEKREKPAVTAIRLGDPVCDCYGLQLYANRTVIAIADGCNWGEAPREAARIACRGFLDHLQRKEIVVPFDRRTLPNISSEVLKAVARAHTMVLFLLSLSLFPLSLSLSLFFLTPSLSLSLFRSLSHTHTHTHTQCLLRCSGASVSVCNIV